MLSSSVPPLTRRHLQLGVVPALVAAAAGGEQLPLSDGDVTDLRLGCRSCPAPGRQSASPAPRCMPTARQGRGAARRSWRRAARGSQPSTSTQVRSCHRGVGGTGSTGAERAPPEVCRRELPVGWRVLRSGASRPVRPTDLPMTGEDWIRPEEECVRTGLPFDDVLVAAQAGAAWAFEVLYRDLSPSVTGDPRLHGAARTRRPRQRDLHRRLHRPPAGSTGTRTRSASWVFTIAHRRLVDDWRRRSRRPQAS